MANELKAVGIIAVTVNPGWVKTDMGGQKAQFTPEQSVGNLYENVLSKISIEDTGKFLNFDGSDYPW
jgi:hypothetical protein